MKAHLRSVRIAPKKANIIAKMVRGMPVHGAMDALHRTNKKGARMVEQLLRSAMANASHNDSQTLSQLVIKSIVVNQGTGYRRGVPMSRGRVRPMTKFLSHISLTLGVADAATTAGASTNEKPAKTPVKKATKKAATASSQTAKNKVKSTPAQRTPSSSDSPSTSAASAVKDPSAS